MWKEHKINNLSGKNCISFNECKPEQFMLKGNQTVDITREDWEEGHTGILTGRIALPALSLSVYAAANRDAVLLNLLCKYICEFWVESLNTLGLSLNTITLIQRF